MRRQMILLVLSVLGSMCLAAAADPPELINYQGVLRNSSNEPLDGSFPMTFRFFDALVGGNEILVDIHGAVTVSGGLFNVELGSGSVTDGAGPDTFANLTAVFAQHTSLYLEIEVQGETLSPRTPVVAVGYALNARRVRGVELVSDGPLDLYVDDDTCPNPGSGTLADPYCSIQTGVDAVPLVLSGPATIHVAAGTYSEEVLIDRRLMWGGGNGSVTLEGNTVSPNVILDGGGILENGISSVGTNVVIRGIRVTGYFEGISIGLGFTAVEQCWVDDNFEGIGVGTGSAEIVDTVIENNSFAGISVQGGEDVIIGGCTIQSNGVGGSGIGIGLSIGQAGFVDIDNCDVLGNELFGIAVSGGSTLVSGSSSQLDVTGNGVLGVFARDNSNVDFNSSPNLTIQSMRAEYHSTIRGHASPCTADSSSLCGPPP